MDQQHIQRAFTEAVDGLVADVRRDRTVLAAILCGSLSYDTVWEKSDVDLVLVTADGKTPVAADATLYANGINIHALLLTRADFRKAIEGSLRNSFVHSFLAKGRLLYSHDPTLADLCASLQETGLRDQRLQVLSAAVATLGPMYKARKWLVTRGDLDYAALWILYAAFPLARVEVIGHGLIADREVIPQALSLNPELFGLIYSGLLNRPKSRGAVQTALEAMEHYVAGRATDFFRPVLEYLREIGEARSCTEIDTHFQRTFGVGGVVAGCEYLSDLGLLGKAATPRRLTKQSQVDVQELAFFYIEPSEPRIRD